MKIIKCLFAGVAALAALTASSVIALAQPKEITVAYFLEWPTANQVAQVAQTYDKEMGVKVNWRAFGNGNEMSLAMASGDVQIAFAQGVVPFVVAVSKGLPLKAVGIAVSYAEADNCVVSNASKITKANAKELEGKKVATPIGNVTHYKLLRILAHLGVDAKKVDMVQMNGADAAVAFARGDVVMGCAFGGPLQRMKETGKELMTAAEQEAIGIRVFDIVSVTDSFAKSSPDLVKKFMDVTNKANIAYAADKAKYQPIIAKAAGMDLPATQNMMGMFSFPTNAEQASAVWLGGEVPKFLKEVGTFFVAQKQMEKALDSYAGVVDTSFIK